MQLIVLCVLCDLLSPIHVMGQMQTDTATNDQVIRIAGDLVFTINPSEHRLTATNITDEPMGVLLEDNSTKQVLWSAPVIAPKQTLVANDFGAASRRATVVVLFYHDNVANRLTRLPNIKSVDMRDWVDHTMVKSSYTTDIVMGSPQAHH